MQKPRGNLCGIERVRTSRGFLASMASRSNCRSVPLETRCIALVGTSRAAISGTIDQNRPGLTAGHRLGNDRRTSVGASGMSAFGLSLQVRIAFGGNESLQHEDEAPSELGSHHASSN